MMKLSKILALSAVTTVVGFSAFIVPSFAATNSSTAMTNSHKTSVVAAKPSPKPSTKPTTKPSTKPSTPPKK